MTEGRRGWLLLLFAGIAMTSAIALQFARDAAYPRESQQAQEILYVRSPAAMKRLTFGLNALAADVYWIRALQHYGGDRLSQRPQATRFQLLYPLLDMATTLDPYFGIAYRFGAIFLGEEYPGGPGRPDQAVALLRKAVLAMPAKWQYYHDIAFVYYWHLHDYQAAAQWFQRAAAQPNAPNWLPPVAASMLMQGRDRSSARFLWQQILKAQEPWLRRAAEHALLQLQALDQIDQLEAAIRRAPPGPGERYSWAALIRKGVLLREPLDPTFTPYEIDPATGRVSVSQRSSLFPMPESARRPL